jgi:hypothetical protein
MSFIKYGGAMVDPTTGQLARRVDEYVGPPVVVLGPQIDGFSNRSASKRLMGSA